MKGRKPRGSTKSETHEDIGAAVQGISKGLGEIMSRLGELGGELTRRFSIQADEAGKTEGAGAAAEKGADRPFKAVYGFSVTVGGPGGRTGGPARIKVEPFGNVTRKADKEVPVHELREPLVDVFEEDAALRIVAEMPGISEKDLRIELEGDILVLSAKTADKHYRKEVLLPRAFRRENMTVQCNNGIVDLKLT